MKIQPGYWNDVNKNQERASELVRFLDCISKLPAKITCVLHIRPRHFWLTLTCSLTVETQTLSPPEGELKKQKNSTETKCVSIKHAVDCWGSFSWQSRFVVVQMPHAALFSWQPGSVHRGVIVCHSLPEAAITEWTSDTNTHTHTDIII